MLKRLKEWLRSRKEPPAPPFVRGRQREDGWDHLGTHGQDTSRRGSDHRSSTGGGVVEARSRGKAKISARVYRAAEDKWYDLGVLWQGKPGPWGD